MINSIGHIKHIWLKFIFIVIILIFILMMQSILDYHGVFDQKITFSQPYRLGDSLIFKINDDLNDTLVISNIEKYVNPDDPLSIYPKWVKTTFVCAKTPEKQEKEILRIEVSRNYKYLCFCDFVNREYASEFFSDLYCNLDSDTYRDFQDNKDFIFGVNQFEYSNGMNPSDFNLKEVRWSANYGYLNFKFKGNREYKLITFIRDGERHDF